MSRSGCNREAVPKRNRGSCLQTCDLDHPGGPRKVQRERSPQVAQRLVSRGPPLIALKSVVDLYEVDPAHDRASGEQRLDPGERRVLAVQPS